LKTKITIINFDIKETFDYWDDKQNGIHRYLQVKFMRDIK